ncbi:hypothetical protein SPYCA_2922 [Sphingopyxis sp. FD7]|nr:hypothetical protein SPYCA_2922 [Sphingopyxis sp. FD7]
MLILILGPWLLRRLTGRLGERWAKAAAQGVTILVILAAFWFAIGAIREDARNDLLAEQAAARAKADAAQRERERRAAQDRRDELRAGATKDAAQQKEISDATKSLPDARPSDRARSRLCVELQQQARRKSEPAPDC